MSYKKIYTEVVKKNVGFDKTSDLVRLYTYEWGCCNKVYLGIKQNKNTTLIKIDDDPLVSYNEISFYPIKNCLNKAPLPKLVVNGDQSGLLQPVRENTNYLYYDGLFWAKSPPGYAWFPFGNLSVGGAEAGTLSTYKNVIVSSPLCLREPLQSLCLGLSKKRIIIGFKPSVPVPVGSLPEIIGPALITTKNIKCPPLSNGQPVKIFPTKSPIPVKLL